jgi:hypothetical protein
VVIHVDPASDAERKVEVDLDSEEDELDDL